ncbi:MAG TPA: TonB-dependent receptor, partial [Novosphingobium sp.]|nr:TonB-dependent receptor [Novosphingobium sp.]
MTRTITAALLAATALASVPAHAQSSGEDGYAANDIIVTARRREENLQDVPIAISAISQEALQQRQIGTELDLQRTVPGLTIRQNYTNSPPGVLTYTNEAQVVSRAASSFFDLSGIQVLKGPQGTLFGRNATGGAVLFETARPGDASEGYLLARYGNYDLARVEGAVSLPLAEDIGLRLAGYYENGGAFVKNVRTGKRLGKQDLGAMRATLVIRPGEGIENRTVVQHTREGGTNVSTQVYSAYACGQTFNGVPLNSTADCVYGPADVFGGFGFYTAANPNIFPGGVDAAADRQRAWGPWKTESGVPIYHKARSTFVVNTTELDLSSDLKLKNIF